MHHEGDLLCRDCEQNDKRDGTIETLFRQNSLLYSLIESCAHSHPSHLSLLSSSATYDFQRLWHLVVVNAAHFRRNGVRRGSKVAIIAHSSPAAVIALLAVLKAGAICIPLSASLPHVRIQNIVQICKASHFVTPSNIIEGLELPSVAVMQVKEQPDLIDALLEDDLRLGPDPQDPAVIIFTSGSTGEPKGVVHSHESLSTMAIAVGKGLSIAPGVRNLLFPAFGWAVNIIDSFSTLAAGACLCIPTEAEKSQNLEDAIRRFQATRTTVPPSLLEMINLDEVPSLVSAVVAGEPIRTNVQRVWGSKLALYWNYGSSETLMVLAGRINEQSSDKLNAGHALCSSRCSIVDANGEELPPGHIGQLVVEGHSNFLGYLEDGEICSSELGFTGCPLIRTGDLFECDRHTGLLIHRGRMNSQLKILGQRFEPTEVEMQLCSVLNNIKELAVTVATLKSSRSPALLALLVLKPSVSAKRLHRMVFGGSFDQLVQVLPSYMIPSGALIVQKLPKLVNGKLDRKGLPPLAEQRDISELLDLRSPIEAAPSNTNQVLMEKVAHIWTKVLGLKSGDVTPSSSFFLLGGNSLDAMGACKELRHIGFATSILDIFLHPRLSELVDFVSTQGREQQEKPGLAKEDGSLIPSTNKTALYKIAAEQCGVNIDSIEDVFPCTALQSGMMTLSQMQEGTYIAEHTFELPETWSREAFIDAWLQVAKTIPILRSRIFQDKKGKLYNVTLRFDGKDALPFEFLPDQFKMTYGLQLFFHSIRFEGMSRRLMWHWRIHHSLYDRWSTSLILERIERAHGHQNVAPLAPFSLFSRAAIQQEHSKEARNFWRSQLESFAGVPFPQLPHNHHVSRASSAIEFNTTLNRLKTSTTQATSIQLALATLISRMQGESDIVFGMTLHGRVIPGCPEADRVVGPVIATVPVRVRVNGSMKIQERLEHIQKQVALISSHEHYGLHNIKSLGAGPTSAASFTTLLIIQPELTSSLNHHPQNIIETSPESSQNYLDYPVVFECFPYAGGIKTKLMYDPNVLSPWNIETISGQFDALLTQLESRKDPSMAIMDLNLLSEEHKGDVLRMSCRGLLEYRQCLHDRIFEKAAAWSTEPAIDGWDAGYSYTELCQLSQMLGRKLSRELGPASGNIIPICYQKSATAIVAMLTILSAGYGFLMLDPALPAQRIKHMVEMVNADMVICSSETRDSVHHLRTKQILFEDVMARAPEIAQEPVNVQCSPESPAYCIFTSGSTGLPKGVLLLHKQATSGLESQCEVGLYLQKSRLLQFSGYSFDTYIADVFATLLSGGCICVPKDEARLTHIAENINRFSADTIDLTPSVARMIEPEAVPQLKVLRLGGELMSDYHTRKWAVRCNLQNTYGPSECCVQCTFINHVNETASPSVIGKGIGCNTWVIDPQNRKFLAPLGAVGELAIQGPAVASGYINNEEKTKASFLESAPWLETYNIQCNYPTYLTGDLVKFDEQGNLVFIGRKDAQIKIRGQRVELGEIEHVLEQDSLTNLAVVCFPSIGTYASQLVAVLKPPQAASEGLPPRLANVHHLPKDTSEWIRRSGNRAQEFLPAHMVPTAYLVVNSVPLMPSGKVDRKSLQKWLESLGDEDLAIINTYQAMPTSESTLSSSDLDEVLVSSIVNKVQNLLSWDPSKPQIKISTQAPFSRIGIDSITIVSLLKWINETYHANMDMKTMLRLETIQKLAFHVQTSGNEASTDDDGLQESFLDMVEKGVDRLSPNSSQGRPFRKLLLTGGSGFVGLHILREILHQFPLTRVVVLARSADAATGKASLIERVRRIGPWNDAFSDRLEVWPGDLAQDNLGLAPDCWSMLRGYGDPSAHVDGIIHNGAVVDWFQGFQALRKVNVDASLELVECAKNSPSIRRMIYVSGGPQWDPDESDDAAFSEDGLRNALAQSNAYGQTKLITSGIIQRAAARNPNLALKLAVVRPALIIGSSTDGVPNIDDFIWRVVMGCHAAGAYPREDPDGWVYLSGGDVFASIVRESLSAAPWASERKVHNGLPVGKFWQVVSEVLQDKLECLDYDAWLQRLKRDIAASGSHGHPGQPVLHMIESSPQLLGSTPPRTADAAWVRQTVEETALTVRRNLQYMFDVGCFSKPEAAWSSKVLSRSRIR